MNTNMNCKQFVSENITTNLDITNYIFEFITMLTLLQVYRSEQWSVNAGPT